MRRGIPDHVYEKVPNFIPEIGWTVYDVHAHVGIFTVQQAARGAEVFAFEPNPDCFRRLLKTTAANRLRGTVHASNCAVGAAPGMGLLNLPSAGRRRPFGGTVVPTSSVGYTPGHGHVGVLPVTVTSLDTVVTASGVTHIDLLNIYKSELEVLRGAVQTLSRTERVIVEYRSAQDRAQKEELLLAAGFTLRCDDVDANGFGNLYMQRAYSGAS